MYLASNIRGSIDKEVELLAQAINKNSRESGVYATETVLGYAIAKLLARVGKIKSLSVPTVLGTIEMVKLEFSRKVAASHFDRERNLNGDVFSELM